MIGVAALLLLAVPAHAAASPAGVYEIRQMEVAGGLELKGDGHFRYALSYGAVDEECEGDWTFDGKTVRLTSKPMPKAPSFELVRDDPAPKGELFMTLEDPGFEWGHPLEAIAVNSTKRGFAISAGDSGPGRPHRQTFGRRGRAANARVRPYWRHLSFVGGPRPSAAVPLPCQ